jgi:N-acetylglucosamine-6-phosphate deacetylase
MADPLFCRHYRTGEPLVLDGIGENPSLRGASAAETGSAAQTDYWIAPALCDIQVNGFCGVDYTAADLTAEKIAFVARELAKHGITRHCPTILTADPRVACASLRILARACEDDPKIAAALPGFHLEGPYIAAEDGPRGAHPAAWARDPDWEEFLRFRMQRAGGYAS